MQRRPITTTTAGATSPTAFSPEFHGSPSHHIQKSFGKGSAMPSSSLSLRQKAKKLNRPLFHKLIPLGRHDDDAKTPFWALMMGALCFGLTLLTFAVGYRMIMAHVRSKEKILSNTPFGHRPAKHTAHLKNYQLPERGVDTSTDGSDSNDDDDNFLDPLPFHTIYRIPEAMETMGDRSAEYARLRQLYDTQRLPLDYGRSLQFIQQVTKPIPPSFLNLDGGGGHNNNVPLPRMPLANNRILHQPSEQFRLLHQHHFSLKIYEPYDIHNCPFEPPRNYPREWNLVHQVLKHWPVEDTNVPKQGIHQGLCQFDYRKDHEKAMHYRELELPFVVTNDPRVARTAERWHDPDYMEQMVGPDVLHRTEYNTNNQFMYRKTPPGEGPYGRVLHPSGGSSPDEQQEEHDEKEEIIDKESSLLLDLRGRKAELQNPNAVPTLMRMTYREWLEKANVSSNSAGEAATAPDQEHWYFRLIACGFLGNDGSCMDVSTEALYDELPFFQPLPTNGTHANPNALYLGDPEQQKGIHCRFGMKGVIAENHFDASRNSIALLMGQRRYVLSHPNQCSLLTLLPQGHDSGRHSAVDYTNPDLQRFPEFSYATANEVILQAGQVLYLPTNWFHYIVSLDLNYQCNTRSGATDHYMDALQNCGFLG